MSKQIKENERQLLNTGDVLVFAFGAMIGWDGLSFLDSGS